MHTHLIRIEVVINYERQLPQVRRGPAPRARGGGLPQARHDALARPKTIPLTRGEAYVISISFFDAQGIETTGANTKLTKRRF